jgi:signal transduction histidine kinase
MSKYVTKVTYGVIYYLTFGFLLFLHTNCSAQSFKIEDIKIVKNVDSLGKNLLLGQPQVHLNQLLTLERSWSALNSPKPTSKLDVLHQLILECKRKDLLPLHNFWKGKRLTKERKHAAALKVYTTAMGGFKTNSDVGMIYTLHEIADPYERNGDLKYAFAFADASYAIQDSIYKTDNINKLSELEAQSKSKDVEGKNEILVRENELIKNRNRAITIGLIATGLLSVFLIMALVFLCRKRREAQIQTAEVQRLASVRDHYINIIAHDLRSPILAMQGMYEMIKESIRNKRYSDLERIPFYIDETGVNTRHLLDNLFNWGLTQREEMPYNPQNLNVAEEVSEALRAYEAAKIINKLTFVVECNPDLQVYADHNGFQLIIRNLVDNALKSLPRGGLLELFVYSNTDGTVTISVRDNGAGMTESKLDVINKVFTDTVHTKISQNGLGLGITLIGRFVQKNKGSIIARLNSSKGCTFDLTLPQGIRNS